MFQRPDQRHPHALRPIQVTRRFTKYAPGSVLICYGDTQLIVTATIEERVPRHVPHGPNDTAGWLTAEYALLPASTQVRSYRERNNKISGRTAEIQRLIGRCLRAAVDLSRLGQRTITIDADVIQADGGTRVAAITGGYIALVDALRHLQQNGLLGSELPLLSPIAAVSVGIIQGEIFLDLNYEEDSQAEVDANVVMNAKGELIEIQAASEQAPYDRDLLNLMLDTAESGIRQLFELQEQALNELSTIS